MIGNNSVCVEKWQEGEEKTMICRIVTIPGDGIGPEIVREACKVLDKVGQIYGHEFHYTEILMGGCSIDTYGVPLTDEAFEARGRTFGDSKGTESVCQYSSCLLI